MPTMGERIATIRMRRGLAPAELAKQAGIPVVTLLGIERGIRQGDRLHVGTVRRLAQALGVSVDYLVGLGDLPAVVVGLALVGTG